MKPILLCYHLGEEKASKIRFTAMRLSICLRAVEPTEYGQSLAALCGLEPMEKTAYQGEDFSEEMLVMAGFSDGLIHQFLQGLRRMKVAPVSLKAILTDTNSRWNSLQLRNELCAEREAVLAAGKAVHQPEKG